MGRVVDFVPSSSQLQEAIAGDLSPWPTEPMMLATAVELLGAAIVETDEAKIRRWGAAASALVERYAPGAPQPLRNEAVIRTSGWMSQQPMAAIRGERLGELGIDYAPSSMSALRHSGSMGLLTAWKIRRGGCVG